MEWVLLPLALIAGGVIGWSAKTSWMESYVHIERAQNGNWIIYMGPRIVGRAPDEATAEARRRMLLYALRGERAPREE